MPLSRSRTLSRPLSPGDRRPGTPCARRDAVRSETSGPSQGHRTSRRAQAPAGLAAALAVLVAVVCGCAKPGSPGGGPPDEQPPEVVRTEPADGATMVDTASGIEIEFSEEMNRPSVERALAIVPDAGRLEQSWKGRTLRVQAAESFPESTTVVVEIASSAQDYHNVASGRPFSFAFSTGASMDSGVISGTVTSGGDPVKDARVWACQGAAEADSNGIVRPCGYGTSTDESGAFTIRRVRATPTPYTVVAFRDGNGDGRYAPASETGGVLQEGALVEAQGDSVGGLVVPVEPPTPPRGQEQPARGNEQEQPAPGTEQGQPAPGTEQRQSAPATAQEQPAAQEGEQ